MTTVKLLSTEGMTSEKFYSLMIKGVDVSVDDVIAVLRNKLPDREYYERQGPERRSLTDYGKLTLSEALLVLEICELIASRSEVEKVLTAKVAQDLAKQLSARAGLCDADDSLLDKKISEIYVEAREIARIDAKLKYLRAKLFWEVGERVGDHSASFVVASPGVILA